MTKRVSPLNMGMKPKQSLEQRGWNIHLAYQGEGVRNPVALCDLSHVPKRTLQSHDLDSNKIGGLPIPSRPGDVVLQHGVLVIRLTPIECRIMSLDDHGTISKEPQCINVTDAFATFGVIGEQCFDVLSKLSPVDLNGPGMAALFATRAPVEDIVCLLVRIQRDDGPPGLIVSCSRGYGEFLLKVFLDAGKSFGIAPAGWQRFSRWLNGSR